MCCKRARPHKGRPTSLIRDIRDRASGGNQMHEASHPSRARPSEPNSTPPTGPAGLLIQPETASAINTGGPLHEPGRRGGRGRRLRHRPPAQLGRGRRPGAAGAHQRPHRHRGGPAVLATLPLADRERVQLRRGLQMVLRLLAYNGEAWLAEHFNAHLADPDEHRAILRHLLHLGGRVDYQPAGITVTLDRPDSPRVAHALELLTDELNATPAHLPGDRRPLTYQLAQP